MLRCNDFIFLLQVPLLGWFYFDSWGKLWKSIHMGLGPSETPETNISSYWYVGKIIIRWF